MHPGIVIQCCGNLPNDSIAICTNSGVYSEESGQSGGRRFLPRDDWRPLTASEKALLFTSQNVALPDAVTVFKINSAVREYFWQNAASVICAKDSTITAKERTTALWACADQIINAVSEIGITAKSLRSCDIQITPSPSNSTACDHSRGHYIGLHIDNHDKLPLGKRRHAFQLLCLNLGQAERHLFFINIGAPDLAAQFELDPARADERYAEAWRLTNDFFVQNPAYPVVRITLPPDYAYIAVTQNFIHDGGTNVSGYPDIAMLLAGQYRFGGNQGD
jgi:hypothetical protein